MGRTDRALFIPVPSGDGRTPAARPHDLGAVLDLDLAGSLGRVQTPRLLSPRAEQVLAVRHMIHVQHRPPAAARASAAAPCAPGATAPASRYHQATPDQRHKTRTARAASSTRKTAVFRPDRDARSPRPE
jgi:hypothetical protein